MDFKKGLTLFFSAPLVIASEAWQSYWPHEIASSLRSSQRQRGRDCFGTVVPRNGGGVRAMTKDYGILVFSVVWV